MLKKFDGAWAGYKSPAVKWASTLWYDSCHDDREAVVNLHETYALQRAIDIMLPLLRPHQIFFISKAVPLLSNILGLVHNSSSLVNWVNSVSSCAKRYANLIDCTYTFNYNDGVQRLMDLFVLERELVDFVNFIKYRAVSGAQCHWQPMVLKSVLTSTCGEVKLYRGPTRNMMGKNYLSRTTAHTTVKIQYTFDDLTPSTQQVLIDLLGEPYYPPYGQAPTYQTCPEYDAENKLILKYFSLQYQICSRFSGRNKDLMLSGSLLPRNLNHLLFQTPTTLTGLKATVDELSKVKKTRLPSRQDVHYLMAVGSLPAGILPKEI